MYMLLWCFFAILWYNIVDTFLPMYSVNPITYHVMSCHACMLLRPYLTYLPFLVLLTTLTSAMLLHGFFICSFLFCQ
jgi:hypothetical protein